MDPHVYPEQPGWSPDAGKNEDSVNHLRRLKEDLAESAPAHAAADHDARVAAAMAASGFEERRKSPRLRCSGSAEIRGGGSDARMWGTLTDVSLHGCYVEMSNTFPVDTVVNLVLKSCGIQIQAPGRVRASYPALGMGICFGEIEPGQHLQLKQLLALLTGHGAACVGGPGSEEPGKGCGHRHEGKLAIGRSYDFPRRHYDVFSEAPTALARRVLRDRQTGSPLLSPYVLGFRIDGSASFLVLLIPA